MGEVVDLSVVLPAYLEEENLRVVLPRVIATLDGLGIQWEVLVVDTNPALDKTAAVCAINGCACVPRERGNNFGDAVRTGIRHSQGARVVFMDADGSHAPEFIADLWSHRDEGDVVIASRYTPGGVTENNWALIAMSRLLNFSYSWILGLQCRDVSNSFKMYPGDSLRRLTLVCDHFDVVEEILYKIVLASPGLRLKEIPFAFKKRMFGDTKRNLVLFIISYLYTIVRLRCMTATRHSSGDRDKRMSGN